MLIAGAQMQDLHHQWQFWGMEPLSLWETVCCFTTQCWVLPMELLWNFSTRLEFLYYVIILIFLSIKYDTTEVYVELDVLVNLTQFQTLLPDTTVIHLDPGTLILYEKTVVPVSSIHGCTSHPNLIIKWVEQSHFIRFDPQVCFQQW